MGRKEGGGGFPPSDYTIATTILGLIQFAPLIMVTMWLFPAIREDHVTLFAVALVFLTGVAVSLTKAFRRLGVVSPLAVIFTFVTFTAFIDFFLALSLAFPWFELGRFYMEHGEKYFRCTYGFFCLLWDGTFHFAIQFALAFLVVARRDYHFVALVWAGSILNSMAPLLLGAATGPYSDEILLSTALNGPFVFVPLAIILYCFRQVDRPDNNHGSPLPPLEKKTLLSGRVVIDAILLLYNFVVPMLHLIRAMCVLGSQTPVALYWRSRVEPILDGSDAVIVDVNDEQDYAFIRVQVLQWTWWFAIWHWLSVYESVERIRTKRRTFLLGTYGVDIAAIVFGGYLQSIVLYVNTQAFDMRDGQFGLFRRSHIEVSALFWLVNVFTLIASGVQFARFYYEDIGEGGLEKKA